MLVSDFMVYYMLKSTQRYFYEMHRMFNEDAKKKKEKERFCHHGRDDQIATCAKLLYYAQMLWVQC